jgi:hypothetical protein
LGTPTTFSSTKKTDRSDITELLLKIALNSIKQTKPPTYCLYYRKEESNIAVKLLPFINKIFRFLRIVPLSFINNVTIEWD